MWMWKTVQSTAALQRYYSRYVIVLYTFEVRGTLLFSLSLWSLILQFFIRFSIYSSISSLPRLVSRMFDLTTSLICYYMNIRTAIYLHEKWKCSRFKKYRRLRNQSSFRPQVSNWYLKSLTQLKDLEWCHKVIFPFLFCFFFFSDHLYLSLFLNRLRCWRKIHESLGE